MVYFPFLHDDGKSVLWKAGRRFGFPEKQKKKDSSPLFPNIGISQSRGVFTMINNNILLNNPLIPEGYYYAKVIEVEAEPADHLYPKLLVTLQLHPMHGLSKETHFRAILFPTDKSFFHYKNFFNTFMPGKNTDDLDKAVGTWGSIQIYNSEFGEIEYSAVKFCYQPRWIMMESWRLTKEEKNISKLG